MNRAGVAGRADSTPPAFRWTCGLQTPLMKEKRLFSFIIETYNYFVSSFRKLELTITTLIDADLSLENDLWQF